jgi:tetratricopeptide (TPR) repeat protein
MLVIPEGPEVRLVFRRLAIDWIGIGLTVFGLGVCVAARRARAWPEPSGRWARVLEALHPWLLGPGIVVVLLLTAWHTTRSWGSDQLYARGWSAFEAGAYADAVREFERVRWLGPSSRHAADATFFRAASLLRMNDPAAALEGYEQVIAEHPDSIWVAESHFHVGLCLVQLQRPEDAARRFQLVIDTYPRNRWAGFAAEQLEKLGRAPPASAGTPGG